MRRAAQATAGFVVVTTILTWPLLAQMHRSLPGDYGEPLLATWAIAWVSGTFARADLAGLWTANIFFPDHGTLAFSHHFIGQALLAAPVHWVSGNPILAYNTAFLLTFVLMGAGTFLLARALTGSDAASYTAGLIAAFNHARLTAAAADLAALSTFWLPFALYALHCYFVTDRRRYLAAAAAFLVALHLSSLDHLAYAAPALVVFAIVDGVRLHRLSSLRVWLELWAAAAAVAVSTMPFALPAMAARQRAGVGGRLGDVIDASDAASWMMLLLFAAALIAAIVVAAIERRRRLVGRIVAATAAAVFVITAQPGALPLNGTIATELAPPPAYLTPAANLPAIYGAVDALRPGAILAELPFGDPAYELRYMYFSTLHRRRMLNGYSTIFPVSYRRRQRVLAQPLLDPPAALQAIGNATHVVVHRDAWRDDTGARLVAWLEELGATRIAEAHGAVLLELPVRENFARLRSHE